MTAPVLRSEWARRAFVVASVVAFVATVVALVFGGRLADLEETTRDSWARGPIGHRALYDTLSALEFEPARLRHGHYETARGAALFLEPDAPLVLLAGRHVALATVLAERARRGDASIVALPKWSTVDPRPDARVIVAPEALALQVAQAALPGGALIVLRQVQAPSGRLVRSRARGPLGTFDIEVPWPQRLVAYGDVRVLLADDEGALVLEHKNGTIVVADPDLAHNFDVQRADHAAVWAALLGYAQRGRSNAAAAAVHVDEVFHGHGRPPTIGEALSRFPAVLLVAHVTALALLCAWAGLRRFGSARAGGASHLASDAAGPAPAIELPAALLAAGHRPGLLAAAYVRELLDDLAAAVLPARAVAVSPAERAAALDAFAAQRGVRAGTTAVALLRAVAVIEDGRAMGRLPEQSALELAREAYAYQRALRHRAAAVGTASSADLARHALAAVTRESATPANATRGSDAPAGTAEDGRGVASAA